MLTLTAQALKRHTRETGVKSARGAVACQNTFTATRRRCHLSVLTPWVAARLWSNVLSASLSEWLSLLPCCKTSVLLLKDIESHWWCHFMLKKIFCDYIVIDWFSSLHFPPVCLMKKYHYISQNAFARLVFIECVCSLGFYILVALLAAEVELHSVRNKYHAAAQSATCPMAALHSGLFRPLLKQEIVFCLYYCCQWHQN